MSSSGGEFEGALKRFLDHFEKISNCADEDIFLKEFMTLKTQSQKYRENNTYPMEAGQMPCNKKKNRFKDILPFEYTRVSLHPIEGVEGSDYINANYITGLDDQVTYIASQGPLPHTVSDFWRMIWYHNIEIVVMACKIIEMAKPKCERYWPEVNETLKIGAINVTTLNEQNISNDFVIRDLMAECQGEQQYIRQYHYAAWPDHGKPSSPEPVLRMLDRIHSDRKRLDVPVVIHCSAGCGRTGTIVGIDVARTMLERKIIPGDELLVYKIVEKMRQQRPAMVQAKDQYVFVYLAIAELCKRALGLKPCVPVKSNGRPIEPVPASKTPVDTSADNIYANTSGTPPKKPSDRRHYENMSVAAGNGSSDSTGGDAPEKLKPVPRTRNSVRQRGIPGAAGGGVESVSPVPSPTLLERDDEMIPGMRADSSSPDPRANAPSPRPKPRSKRNLADHRLSDGDLTASGRSESPSGGGPPPPVPPSKPYSTQRGPPPKMPKVTNPSSSQGTKKKPLPPPHPRESTPERRAGGAAKRSSNGNQDKSEVVGVGLVDEDPYSPIDRTQFTDTGPSIQVLDVSSGRSVPLEFVEKELGGDADTSKSSSILDTIMSLVGDEVLEDIDQGGSESPPPIPDVRQSFDYGDEAPPIPAHTMASMELVESTPPPVPPPKPSGGSSPKVESPSDALLSTYDVVGAVTEGEIVYEQPEAPKAQKPPKLSVPNSSQKASSFHGPHVSKGLAPPLPPPNNKSLDSSSTATAISTMSRNTSDASINGQSKQKKGGLFSSFGRKGHDKKKDKQLKSSLEEISGPLISGPSGLVKSPSINTMSSSTSSSHSPMHDRANNKYNFPGDLGYGIRIRKPVGPRREPPHWANALSPPPIANKA